ncbi:DUF4164 family protein [Phenylobacterium sp.]|uniref:DUF4164 family protein n=1 Tax=Phenylobacterium sp. TaxID=1871053 RepID=UPI00272FA277|nr:DUF4164 family protein [Phenylobacterium sp.]MDP1874422.1 DUF4164 family protein [Phenylobacterium sp.]MDP3300209.1 DUF4164 family protein [Phenylobacterium sp.]
MIRDPASESAIDQAARRLERAIALLEQRLGEAKGRAGLEAGGLFDQDRAKLAAELDEARAREKALAAAGVEASAALGRAIAEIREVLETPEDDEPAPEEEEEEGEPELDLEPDAELDIPAHMTRED